MFVWNEAKRRKVLKDHGIDFALIVDAFEDPSSYDFFDNEHSDEKEIRVGLIGRTAHYGLIVLIYSVIDDEEVRLITARRAEKWMVRMYEENRKRI